MAHHLKLLMLGLPESGKTTFLAAMWNRVNDPTAESRLDLERLGEGDRSYLNEIADAWNRHEKVPRTPRGANRRVVMHLIDDEGDPATLTVPDLSGESFRAYLQDREWDQDYDNLVSECRGLLLFLHPDDVVPSVPVEDAERLIRGVAGDDPSRGGELGRPPEDANDDLPAASASVELLQFHHHVRPHLPTAVIVSAWDLIPDAQKPTAWLEEQMPLLHQYLIANRHRRPYSVFGVSAQGGDYEDDRNALIELEPRDRTRIVSADYESNDLTRLIEWTGSHEAHDDA